jgi:hypothetical protein
MSLNKTTQTREQAVDNKENSMNSIGWRTSVAPMLDWTD